MLSIVVAKKQSFIQGSVRLFAGLHPPLFVEYVGQYPKFSVLFRCDISLDQTKICNKVTYRSNSKQFSISLPHQAMKFPRDITGLMCANVCQIISPYEILVDFTRGEQRIKAQGHDDKSCTGTSYGIPPSKRAIFNAI